MQNQTQQQLSILEFQDPKLIQTLQEFSASSLLSVIQDEGTDQINFDLSLIKSRLHPTTLNPKSIQQNTKGKLEDFELF